MPEQSTTLRDMIQEALSSGLTLRQLEERAIDPETGSTVSKDTFNKIVLGRVHRMPLETHLRAIAAGLRAPYESVRRAAIAQWLPAESASGPETDATREEIAELLAKARRLIDQANELDRRNPRGGQPKSA